jgi:hypothetical protein
MKHTARTPQEIFKGIAILNVQMYIQVTGVHFEQSSLTHFTIKVFISFINGSTALLLGPGLLFAFVIFIIKVYLP